MSTDVSLFFESLRKLNIDITTHQTSLSAAMENIGEFERTTLGIVKIALSAQVRQVVELANKYRISLYPFSCGLNWGYGSKLPTKSNTVLLDLSKLNKIIHIDEEQGVASIQPGVTQRQLSQELLNKNSRYYVDVTGSGADTSILGNSLQRGIAYSSLRVKQVASLEVVLGNGKQIQTGFGSYKNKLLSGLYPYGLGPDLSGLFFQSNFGVITGAKIHLLPRPEAKAAISVLTDEKNLNRCIDKVSWLKQSHYLSGIPHIANTERTISTMIPLVTKQINCSEEQAKLIIGDIIGNYWTLTTASTGNRKVLKHKLKQIKKSLGPLGKVHIHHFNEVNLKNKIKHHLIQLLATKNQKLIIKAGSQLRGFHEGIASDAGIDFLKYDNNKSIDSSSQKGFLLCTPLAPLKGENSKVFIDIAQNVCKKHNSQHAITLNLISDRILEAVISVHFNRSSESEAKSAQDTVKEMTKQFAEKGLYPYRVNIDQMDNLKYASNDYIKTLKDLKNKLDPNGIIAPGSYELT